MKRAVVILFILLIVAGCASMTTTPLQEKPVVIKVYDSNKEKDDIYRIANEWMVETFKSSSEVIQYQDKEEGVIIGKGLTLIGSNFAGSSYAHFTIKIETKENKTRLSITDVYLEIKTGGGNTSKRQIENQETWKKVKAELIDIADSYKNKLMSSSNESW